MDEHMKKEMTYLTKLVADDGRMVDFERWNYKRISTGIQNQKKLFEDTFCNYAKWTLDSLKKRGNKAIEYIVVEDGNGKELCREPYYWTVEMIEEMLKH